MADHKPNEGSASDPTGGANFKATARTFFFEGGNLELDLDKVMRSVLNSIRIGELAHNASTEDILFQPMPPVTESPVFASVPNPSFELPLSQLYIKLHEFMKWMQKQPGCFSKAKRYGPEDEEYIHDCTEPVQCTMVLEKAQDLIEKDARTPFLAFAEQLKEMTSPDLNTGRKILEEIVQYGHVTQQLGALLLELGRISFNFRKSLGLLLTREPGEPGAVGSTTRNFFLGTENAEDQGYGLVPNVDEVILSVLNTLEIGGLPGTAGLQGMQFPPQAPSPNSSLSTISKLLVKVNQVFCDIEAEATGEPRVEAEGIELNGEPPLRVIGLVLEQASTLLGQAIQSLIEVYVPLADAIPLPKEPESKGEPDFQKGRVDYGLAMHHLGVAFLALGRTLSTYHMGPQ